jgi:DNA polymerase-1
MLVTHENLPIAIEAIQNRDRLAVDLETTGLVPWHTKLKDSIAGIAIYNGSESFYFPFHHTGGRNLSKEILQVVLTIISKTPRIDNWNTKFDMQFCRIAGMPDYPAFIVDGMNAMYLVNEELPRKLKSTADLIFKDGSSSEEEKLEKLLSSWGYGKEEMWRLPPDFVEPYACKDTVLAWNLVDYFEKKLPEKLKVLWHQQNKLLRVVAKMEYAGLPVDEKSFHKILSEAQLGAFLLERNLKEQYPGLNPSSPASIAKTFHVPNAQEETLVHYTKKPGINELLQYKWYTKAINTYYRPYQEKFIDKDWLIHSNFNQLGTKSGRFSSSEPNLQNIPRFSEEQKVKHVFKTQPGYEYLECDYSQAEIRVAAHYTKEPSLIEAIKNGADIHQVVADEAGIDRQTAKTINFATIYGAGAKRLSEQLNCSLEKAQKFLNKYNETYPSYKTVARAATDVATKRKYVEMWNFRRRNFSQKDSEPHTAFNQLIQGGVGQMMIGTMIELDEKLPELSVRVQIHDSLLSIVPVKDIKEIAHEAKKIMEHQPQFIVPMKVDAKKGSVWGEMTKYDLGR